MPDVEFLERLNRRVGVQLVASDNTSVCGRLWRDPSSERTGSAAPFTSPKMRLRARHLTRLDAGLNPRLLAPSAACAPPDVFCEHRLAESVVAATDLLHDASLQ